MPRFGADGSTAREWKFVLLVVLVSATATLSSLVTGAMASVILSIPMNVFDWKANPYVPVLVMACAIVGGAYGLACVCLALPARAIDEPLGIRGALALSKGNEWRLAVLIALLPWFVNWSERSLANAFESAAAYWTISTALYLMLLPMEIAVLSLSYAALRNSQRRTP